LLIDLCQICHANSNVQKITRNSETMVLVLVRGYL
jgi:hypothetical protein